MADFDAHLFGSLLGIVVWLGIYITLRWWLPETSQEGPTQPKPTLPVARVVRR